MEKINLNIKLRNRIDPKSVRDWGLAPAPILELTPGPSQNFSHPVEGETNPGSSAHALWLAPYSQPDHSSRLKDIQPHRHQASVAMRP